MSESSKNSSRSSRNSNFKVMNSRSENLHNIILSKKNIFYDGLVTHVVV